uniref:Nucleophosmin n=1 Tax=Myotis lucifugus TaxID=59463 RepID=G1Q6Q2_MYOLU
MEESMDMNMSPLRSQSYLFSCELKADKDYHFKVDNDENQHQLGAGAKEELHIVEAEAMNYEGSPIKATLATVKMSVQPTVSLGGFEITPLVVLYVKLLSMSGKRSAPGGVSKVPQKKVKRASDEDDEDEEGEEEEEEEDEEEDDDDEDDDDDFDEEEAVEKAPVKKSIRDTPAKNTQKSNQNGKDSKPSAPRSKGQESFKKQEKTPKTPKGPSSVEDIKAKMQASIEKAH